MSSYPEFPGIVVKWRKRGRSYQRLFKTINGANNHCDRLEQDRLVKDIEISLPPVPQAMRKQNEKTKPEEGTHAA